MRAPGSRGTASRSPRAYPQRTALDVRATAGTIDRVFDVRLMDWRGARGQVFHAPLGAATVPGDLGRAVSAVAGLDGNVFVTDDSAAIQGLTPASARSVYEIDPLLTQNVTGQGESIAVVEFAKFDQSDLDAFDQQFNLPDVTPRDVAVNGGASDDDPSSAAEANLDLEVAHEIAPGAELLDYNAPQATSSGADDLWRRPRPDHRRRPSPRRVGQLGQLRNGHAARRHPTR